MDTTTEQTGERRRPRPSARAEAAAPVVAGQLLELYPVLVRELRRELERTGPGTLTIPQFRILCHLRDEPATNKALAEQAGVSVAATSRMVDGLESRGLLRRERDEGDKRLCHLHLTPRGAAEIGVFQGRAVRVLERRLSQLPQPELDALHRSLGPLLAVFGL